MYLHTKVPFLSLLHLVEHGSLPAISPSVHTAPKDDENSVPWFRPAGYSVTPENPVKRRILSISYRTSSICRSDRLNQFCRQSCETCSPAPSVGGPAAQPWDNAAQCATAKLTRTLPFTFRLKKPPGASSVSCDCSQDLQSSISVTWRI